MDSWDSFKYLRDSWDTEGFLRDPLFFFGGDSLGFQWDSFKYSGDSWDIFGFSWDSNRISVRFQGFFEILLSSPT